MLGKAILQRDVEVVCVRTTNGIIRVTSDEILRVLKAVIRVSQDQTHKTTLSIQVFLSVYPTPLDTNDSRSTSSCLDQNNSGTVTIAVD